MDLMVDIETLSTSQHNAVVTSIGAVQFVLTTNGPSCYNEGSRCPDLRFQIIAGREVDPDTVRFWQDHRDAAKHWLNAPVTSVAETMRWLADMYSGGKCESVWTHGTDFDVPNIRSLFAQDRRQVPMAVQRGARRSHHLQDAARSARVDTAQRQPNGARGGVRLQESDRPTVEPAVPVVHGMYRLPPRREVRVVEGQAALNRIVQAANAERIMAKLETWLQEQGIDYEC